VAHFGPGDAIESRGRLPGWMPDVGVAQPGRSGLQAAHKRAEALIAGAYLSVPTRRGATGARALFGGAWQGLVSRAWNRCRTEWEAWQKRDLAKDESFASFLDGTVVRVRPTSAHRSCSVVL